MVKDVIACVGIDTEDRLISNQSLRASAMNLYTLMGLSEDATARHDGHSSSKTQRFYKHHNTQHIAPQEWLCFHNLAQQNLALFG